MIKNIYKGIIGLAIGGVAYGGATITDSQINPYTDKIDRMEMSLVQDIPESGESKIELLKDRPEMRLKKWNGEVDLGVSYSKVKGSGNRPLLSNKIEWKDAKEEVHAYPIDDDNFEFEIILKEKPNTNVFDFTIDGYENLVFFYQPEISDYQAQFLADKKGISLLEAKRKIRPENVVGSYAVYHKEKKNHIKGQTNYATGKAFHIYRPKAIDANGVEQWAELSYEAGILRVIVPQSFLDNAIYPVRVDPTFGYTSLGASFVGPSQDKLYGTRFTAPSDMGTVTSISHAIVSDLGADRTFKQVVVLQSSLNIVTNGVSNSALMLYDVDQHADSFVTASFGTVPTLSASTDYVMFIIHNDSGWSNYSLYDTGTANYYYFDGSNSYTTPTNPTDAVTTGDDNGGPNNAKLSQYITYTAAGGGSPSIISDIIFFE